MVTTWTTVGSSGYAGAQVSVTPGYHYIHHSTGVTFGTVLYGQKDRELYATSLHVAQPSPTVSTIVAESTLADTTLADTTLADTTLDDTTLADTTLADTTLGEATLGNINATTLTTMMADVGLSSSSGEFSTSTLGHI